MRRWVGAGIGMAMIGGVVTPCRADDPPSTVSPPACREAFEEADLALRPADEPHLLRARELLRKCASPSCRPWMISDCAKSLVEVERRIPTVVLTAHVAGRPVVDARVREGATLLAQHLDGLSIEIEPGVHDLVLELPSGQEVQGHFVVEEGARLQHLDFEVAPPPLSSPPVPDVRPPPPPSPRRAPDWLRTSGIVASAAGVGMLALGSAFGIAAWHLRDSARCDSRGLCDAEPLSQAHSASTVSTVGFVVGGSLLAAGLGAFGLLWATRPVPTSAR